MVAPKLVCHHAFICKAYATETRSHWIDIGQIAPENFIRVLTVISIHFMENFILAATKTPRHEEKDQIISLVS